MHGWSWRTRLNVHILAALVVVVLIIIVIVVVLLIGFGRPPLWRREEIIQRLHAILVALSSINQFHTSFSGNAKLEIWD